MNAITVFAGRRGRLAAWFGTATAEPGPATTSITHDADPRLLVDRHLFDEIGAFLFTHRLAPTPAHFAIGYGYVTGSDPAIAGAITALLSANGRLNQEDVASLIADARPDETGSSALAALAQQLESRLSECLHAATRTHSSARDYGDALDEAQSRMVADPLGTLDRLAGLTREVVSTTRLVETELRRTRAEAERLRGDLEQAREAAERDHLTGLPNRRGFERRVDTMLAEAAGCEGIPQRAVVALCDIDDFKRVNDVHGHQAGDRVLRYVGTFLANELGTHAYVARHGGEEFAVLIEGRSSHEALLLLDEVREKLSARSLVNQDTGLTIGRITFSAGLAPLDGDATSALEAADAALYHAKRGGKNDVTLAPQAKLGAGGRPSR